MADHKNVFIVGPGFIGWNVIDNLVAEGYRVKGLVRREAHAKGIEASGATSILSDLNDKKTITDQTVQHDIVIHTATADHLPSVEAIIDGIRKRAADGKQTIFLHTSGTSVLDDGSNGEYKNDKVFHDKTRAEVDSVPDSAPHREIDLAIVKAQTELGDKAKIAILIPPLIYGYNPKHKRLTIQIPTLTRWAWKHGYAPHVGKGLAVESNIHVIDLGHAYTYVLHHLEKSSPAQTRENPYFFIENSGDNEPSWKEVAAAIGEGLYKAGKITDPAPKTLPKELEGELFGDFTGAVIGLNSRSRAQRLRELGWQPRQKSWKESYFEDELPVILAEDNSSFKGYAGVVAS